MAAKPSTSIESDSKKQTQMLVEEDVPGAALPHDSVEACSVVTFDIAVISKWRPCPAKQSMHALRSHLGPRPQLVFYRRIEVVQGVIGRKRYV
jgi:hypothetical protein